MCVPSVNRNMMSHGLNLDHICWIYSFHPCYLLLQTLEHAFLQLCETSDQIDCKQGSSPQGELLEKSQSFESGKDESRPILGVSPGSAEELPKFSGYFSLLDSMFIQFSSKTL